MRKIGISIIIACLYGFPFVYFSMYKDFVNSSMLGYLIMIVGTSLFAFFGKVFNNPIPLVICNIVSGITSFYFISKMTGNERWDVYFKPFTPCQFLIFVSFLNLIPQLLAIKLANKISNVAEKI